MTSGSATGNPRNKVALKPGHSLMDWIRLGNSGKDLTGVGGVCLNVSKTELEQHNQRDNAWLSIRGKVYNVSNYMDFHPGGEEELMRGVGKDATSLFNQVHAWVNYESILQKCVVGRLGTPALEENTFSTPSSSLSIPHTLGKPSTVSNKVQSEGTKPATMDWFQQIAFLMLVFYTKCTCPQVHISLQNGTLLTIVINNKTHSFKLEAGVSWPCSLTVDTAGKVQVKLNKRKPGLWQSFGTIEVREGANLPEYWPVTVTSIVAVTHDTKQIDLLYKDNICNYIPLGHHVLVKVEVNGEELIRPYTPVTSLISNVPSQSSVRLVVKSYDKGCVSSWLCSRYQGESLLLSAAQGSFNSSILSSRTHLVLIAAGTGITPMVSLISWALKCTRLKVNLLFFNKTEKDIIWREQMEKLMSDNCRFNVEHVLSEAGTEWIGKNGHVSVPLLMSLLPNPSKDIPPTHFVCICGPTLFTQLTERYLKEDLGFNPDSYHCFLGS